MRLGDVLCDKETISGRVSIYFHRILTMPALGKELLFIVTCDADAGVFYCKKYLLLLFLKRHTDRTGGRVIHSIVNKISKDVITDLALIAHVGVVSIFY